jgi:cob(I)alamin adenosyltransferase
MKIYTKKGDGGETSLIGGTRVPKHHIRIEAYGTIDELNSWMGLLRDQDSVEETSQLMYEIQNHLFTIGSHLANDPEASHMALPGLVPDDVARLEASIDAMDAQLPALKNFVLPGGLAVGAQAHIARCVCRRAERCMVHLHEVHPQEAILLQYVNRLSDWLFTYARLLVFRAGGTEVPWLPRK